LLEGFGGRSAPFITLLRPFAKVVMALAKPSQPQAQGRPETSLGTVSIAAPTSFWSQAATAQLTKW
jgi:hypothetical protein